MIIVPTRVCNTDSCNYCGVLKKDTSYNYFHDNFNRKAFIQRLLYISKKTQDNELRLFWWEPFLNFPLIQQIIEALERQDIKEITITINTNLSLFTTEHLSFLKKHDIKIIMSCNWDLYSHCLTRWVNSQQATKLYTDMKTIVNAWIRYQINVVSTPEIVSRLHKNFCFIREKTNWKIFNFLPVNYNGWNTKSLEILEAQLYKIQTDINNNWVLWDISFINKTVNNSVSLFNSEIVIDSDGKIYPNMVILETFFEKEKSNIEISNITKSIEEIKKDFSYYDTESQKIYEQYINTVLKKKFWDILENDEKSSIIFHNFLEKI